MTLLIQASHLAFAHGGNDLFADITFEIREGDRIAVVGENGSGKSTLFRLLAKSLEPAHGRVIHRRGLRTGYLDQEIARLPDTTPRDIVRGTTNHPDAIERTLTELEVRLTQPLGDEEMADVLDAYNHALARLESGGGGASEALSEVLLAGLGLPEQLWDQPVSQLSGGENKMVGIAALLASEPDVLLLDEPDNHLDTRAKTWLERYLADFRGAVGLITHDRYMIDRVANAIFEIEDTRIAAYPGNYSAFKDQKRKKLERESELRALREREFRKLKASAEQLTQWARQNPKFASRAENQRRKVAEERKRLDDIAPLVLDRRTISVDFEAERGGTIVLEADNLGKAYGDNVVFEPFDLLVDHGERVGLVGPNGAGKTTLFRMIQGLEEPGTGRLRTGASLKIGYFSQENETLDRDRTPLDLVRQAKPLNEQQALSVLVEFLFDRDDAMRPVSALSGGERSRVQLAILMLSGANFLLLDEPTNNLDIASVETLEEALLGFGGSLISISHDRYFLDRVCTRIVEVDSGIVRDFPGSFRYYQNHPDKGTVLTRARRKSPGSGSPTIPRKERRRRSGTIRSVEMRT